MNLISFTVYIFEPEAAVLNLGIMFKLFSLPHEKKLSKTKQNIGSIDFLNPRIFESILWNVGHENEMLGYLYMLSWYRIRRAVLINIWIISIIIHKTKKMTRQEILLSHSMDKPTPTCAACMFSKAKRKIWRCKSLK